MRKRVVQSGTNCWIWDGGKFNDGYGQVWYAGKTHRVHRAAAALWLGLKGAILEKEDRFHKDTLLVLHRCDQPLCFNPDHLFIGTPRDNTHDMMEKGRESFNYSKRASRAF